MANPFLYELHEAQRRWMAPWAAFSDLAAQAYSNPYSPLAYTPYSSELAAGFELAHRLSKEYRKPDWNLAPVEIGGRAVDIAEETELALPFCRLLHFSRPPGAAVPRVLVVAPLSGHHATLLRDTVHALLASHDVYITDWVDARMVPTAEGPFGLDDYVRLIQTFLRQLGPDTHVIAVCQPAVPVLAAVSLLATAGAPEQPRSMVMMGGPIDARRSPTRVNHLATTKSFEWFEDNVIYRVPSRYPGAGRRVYPGFLQYVGFVAMHPARHLRSYTEYYQHLTQGDEDDAEAHRRFYDEYNAVLDMPAEYYLDTVRTVFQEFRLPKGSWVIDGVRVDPSAIRRTALLTIEGERDDISGFGQTHAAQALCTGLPPGRKAQFTVEGAGHYGIFSGSRWRTKICPRVAAFIAQHEAPEA